MNAIILEKDDFAMLIRKIETIEMKINEITDHKRDINRWCGIKETCELLQVSKRTLQGYRDNGLLPFSKVGSKILFKATDIEKFLEGNYIQAWNSNVKRPGGLPNV